MKMTKLAMVLFAAGALAACSRGTTKITEVDPHTNPRVYFAFDSSAITEEARTNLLGQSMFLQNNPNVRVTIEGHCDERGTAEYNMALGARRAEAAKNVMVRDGVDARRIRTVSYGKERPQKLGTGEAIWKWNRNAKTVVRN